jgi:hypothetical protein
MCNIYLTDGSSPDKLLMTGEMFPNHFGAEAVEGWASGNEFEIAPTQFVLGGHTFTIAAACPPGRLRDPVAIGLPQRRHHTSKKGR